MKPTKVTRFKPVDNAEEIKGGKKDSGKNQGINIDDRYILQSCIYGNSQCKGYKGIDLRDKKYVTIYLKPTTKQKTYAKKIKEEIKQKIMPLEKESFVTKIQKNSFDVEVHQKFGPSLQKIINTYKNKMSIKTFYLLAYKLLKLLSLIDSIGYVVRNLNPNAIVCHKCPEKTDLFLLNSFDLERKNQQIGTINSKYCSIGSHLGLKTSSKDTFEAMCYILMDIYLQGKLFHSQQKDYQVSKTLLQPAKIPKNFITFFYYVKNLNSNEEFKFNYWKTIFRKQLVTDDLLRPYEWNDYEGIHSVLESRINGIKASKVSEQQEKQPKTQEPQKPSQALQEQEKPPQEHFEEEEDQNQLLEFEADETELAQTINKFTFNDLINSKYE